MATVKSTARPNGFAIISRDVLQNSTLSIEARGLMAYLLSHHESWELRVTQVCTEFSMGKDRARKIIRELMDQGYIEEKKLVESNGQFSKSSRYTVYEDSIRATLVNNTGAEDISIEPGLNNPGTDFPALVTPPLINNIFKKYNYKKTTAITPVPRSEMVGAVEPTKNLAAADLNSFSALTPQDRMIGESLTANQQAAIDQRLTGEVLPEGYSLVQLASEFAVTMLDSSAYSKAGLDFFKKLNTLVKMLRANRWVSPIPSEKTDVAAENRQIAKRNQHHQELLGDVAHCQSMLSFHTEQGNKAFIESFEQQLAQAKQALRIFNARHSDHASATESREQVAISTEMVIKATDCYQPSSRLAPQQIKDILKQYSSQGRFVQAEVRVESESPLMSYSPSNASARSFNRQPSPAL